MTEKDPSVQILVLFGFWSDTSKIIDKLYRQRPQDQWGPLFDDFCFSSGCARL